MATAVDLEVAEVDLAVEAEDSLEEEDSTTADHQEVAESALEEEASHVVRQPMRAVTADLVAAIQAVSRVATVLPSKQTEQAAASISAQ